MSIAALEAKRTESTRAAALAALRREAAVPTNQVAFAEDLGSLIGALRG